MRVDWCVSWFFVSQRILTHSHTGHAVLPILAWHFFQIFLLHCHGALSSPPKRNGTASDTLFRPLFRPNLPICDSRRGQSRESMRLQSSGIAICKSQSKFNQVSAREQSMIAAHVPCDCTLRTQISSFSCRPEDATGCCPSLHGPAPPRASPRRSEPRSPLRSATKHPPPAARSSRAPHLNESP